MARILLFSPDVVGPAMAGPGIRAWELAHVLAQHHEVTLAVPSAVDVGNVPFALRSYGDESAAGLLPGQDVLVTQVVPPLIAYEAVRHGVRIVLDAYDPSLLEVLETHAHLPLREQRRLHAAHLSQHRLSFRIADAVICASEKQRDLWIGSLMSTGRLDVDVYRADPTLRRALGVVPFGLPGTDPVRTGPGLRTALGIPPDVTLLVWGGGIWNWFDPLTLVRAVGRLAGHRDDVKLLFMGLRHPNPLVIEDQMAVRTQALARELELTGRSVYFNEGWVPYAERQNTLLEADVGVSTHFDHLETRFSFRTRILDYLWAGLPIVTTKGDAFADLVRAEGLGAVVDYEDVDGLAEALTGLTTRHDGPARAARAAVGRVRERYRWDTVAEPLLDIIDALAARGARRPTLADAVLGLATTTRLLKQVSAERGFGSTASWAVHRVVSRVL